MASALDVLAALLQERGLKVSVQVGRHGVRGENECDAIVIETDEAHVRIESVWDYGDSCIQASCDLRGGDPG